jgi:5-keto-L-gluconate epimerase
LQAGVSAEQAWEWITAALAEGCAAAEKAGVRIALEPINRYETPFVNTAQEGVNLIRRVGAANLGLLLDTFHMNIEEPSIESSIRTTAGSIFHFHVADSNRWHPGAGHLDFASILAALTSTGYAGFVSGEFLPRPDAQTAAERAMGFLRPVLSRLAI